MDEPTIAIGEVPAYLERLVGQFCALPPDYSDVPVSPEKLSPQEAEPIKKAASLAANGDIAGALAILAPITGSFDASYLMGKIYFANRLYYEAAERFGEALLAMPDYGEAWFYYGVANYQMGLYGEAFMNLREAYRVNRNHEDARILMSLTNIMALNTHRHLNPEAISVLPVVSGRGIDVGCGAAKTHPGAIGVDIIPPGATGEEASQKGRVSQADVCASGDDLHMFADDSLDYVIARHNLEHYADPLKTLLEWKRVLKPGGVIAIVLPDDEAFDTIHADSTHLHVFTKTSLRHMLSLIPELAIMEMGTSQHQWSFYAIIEKVVPGAAPSYPYRRRVNEHTAKDVADRAERAYKAGLNDVASAAFKKLRDLVPDMATPVDPYILFPSPFADKPQARATAGKPVAVINGRGKFFDDCAAAFEKSGVHVARLSIPDKIPWQLEKTLRELEPDFVFTADFNPALSESLANLAIPYVAWVLRPSVGDGQLREEYIPGATTVFCFSETVTEMYKKLSEDNVYYLPSGVAECPAVDSPTADIGVFSEPTNRYTPMTQRLIASLTDQRLSAEAKSHIFDWVRFCGIFMENTKWTGFETFASITSGAQPPPEFGASEREIAFACGDEITARKKNAIMARLNAPERVISKINIMVDKAYKADGVPQAVFGLMVRGAFVMADCDYHDCYNAGTDYVRYTSVEEAVELARYYLTHDEEREIIARRGREKTLAHHSLDARIKTIIDILRKRGAIRKV